MTDRDRNYGVAHMLDESNAHLREIIDDASKLKSLYFKKPVNFSKVIQLSEPNRLNMLLRLLINNPQEGMPKTIILKQTVTKTNKFDTSAKSETEIEKLDLTIFVRSRPTLR